MNQPHLNAGVLVIGSLLWETTDIRANWHRNDLRLQDKIPVPLPIRYGRLSTSRNNTYTMVFSNDCKATPGSGFFVPFVHPITRIDHLHHLVINLLAAEKNEPLTTTFYNLSFCIAGQAINPKHLNPPSTNPLISQLIPHWRDHLDEFNPEHYRVPNENPIVNTDGLLQISWPPALNEFDIIIGTATKPKPRAAPYPTPQAIAQRMRDANDYHYFTKNRQSGITTFQDKDIEFYLNVCH